MLIIGHAQKYALRVTIRAYCSVIFIMNALSLMAGLSFKKDTQCVHGRPEALSDLGAISMRERNLSRGKSWLVSDSANGGNQAPRFTSSMSAPGGLLQSSGKPEVGAPCVEPWPIFVGRTSSRLRKSTLTNTKTSCEATAPAVEVISAYGARS
jgi:hypothetical protein